MTFKELKPNYAVFILHKNDVRYAQGKVVSVSNPRFQNGMGMSFGQTNQQVVDVTIDENGEQLTYTIPETLDVTYANGLVLATSKEKIQYEVEMMKNRAEELIANVDKNKQIVTNCEKILADINPALKDKQKTEERFTALEENMGKMSALIEQLVKKLE